MKKLIGSILLLMATTGLANGEADLVSNGQGVRTKPILGVMYELELHVPPALKGADAQTLVEADQPMAMVLTIGSRLITRARFVEATTEGFAQAAKSGYSATETTAFLEQFADTEFKKGDTVTMSYEAGRLITRYQARQVADVQELSAISSLNLKQALFAIWLGDSPVQESLKKGLLGP